jgi:hypothetical protein
MFWIVDVYSGVHEIPCCQYIRGTWMIKIRQQDESKLQMCVLEFRAPVLKLWCPAVDEGIREIGHGLGTRVLWDPARGGHATCLAWDVEGP